MAVDSTGHSYVTGHFSEKVTFAPGEANETILASTGLREIFVAK